MWFAKADGAFTWGNDRAERRPSRETESFLFPASAIDPRTVQAYLETEYRVQGEPGFILHVGRASADLLSAHKRLEADCSAFLTACNPFSEPFDEAANAARQAELAHQLSSLGLVFLPGIGQHPSNDWPGEESFLVFGLTLQAAEAIGSQWGQNGIVWSGADAVPQLILLK